MNGLVSLFLMLTVGGIGIAVAHVFDRWVQRRRDVHTARTRPVPRSVAAQFAPTRLDAEMARALRQARKDRELRRAPDEAAVMDAFLDDVIRRGGAM